MHAVQNPLWVSHFVRLIHLAATPWTLLHVLEQVTALREK